MRRANRRSSTVDVTGRVRRATNRGMEVLEGRQLLAAAVGLSTNNELVRFDTATPGTIVSTTAVSGLATGENLVGIDIRPATGQLYGLGSTSQLYRINLTTGAATAIGAPASFTLSGTEFGFDFNPTVDRIRVTSNSGQNFRLNPNTGAAVDGDANTGGVQTDGSLAFVTGDANEGNTPVVVGSAYINNFGTGTYTGATTELLNIDAAQDVLTLQSPPNNGGLVTRGSLGIDVVRAGGFDVAEQTGIAFAALQIAGSTGTSLYTINTTTGAATLVGAIGTTVTLRGLAIEPPARTVFGLTTTGNLVTVNPADPSTVLSTVAVSGLASGVTLLGIDSRPATGELFGIGSDSKVYNINTTTGAATVVSTDAFTSAITATNLGVDFNPTVDRIRITGDNAQNLRANPITGAQVDSDTTTDGTQPDGNLAYATGDANAAATPQVIASAYTRNFAGSTSTELLNIDAATDSLVFQNPPNSGTLNTRGALGVDVVSGGFDIAGGLDSSGGNKTLALAALNLNGETVTRFYAVNIETGALTTIGTFGDGSVQLLDIAFALTTTAQFPTLSIGDVTVTEGNATTSTGTVTVTLSAASDQVVVVTLNSADGTATAGTDYTAVTALVLTILPGQTTATTAVTVTGDTTFEDDETVTLTLSAASGATLNDATGTLTIANDDAGARLVADPVKTTRQNLVIFGTPDDDLLRVVKRGSRLEPFLGTTSLLAAASKVNRIIVHAGAGNDTVRLDSKLSTSATIFGGAGNDTILAGQGRDLVIGGAGTDYLRGRGGEDILIGGTTTLDSNDLAIARLVDALTGKGKFSDRVSRISSGTGITGGFAFNNSTVQNDSAADVLLGDATRDFLLFSTLDIDIDADDNDSILQI